MSDSRTRLQTVLKALGLNLKAYEGTDWTSRARAMARYWRP